MGPESSELHSDGAVPLELARRLLTSHYPYATADACPRILVGRLPVDPPFEVPIQDGFTLLGSAVSEASRGRPMVEVVLDTELPAERVREVYRELLISHGWSEDHRAVEPGGFARGPRGFLMALGRVVPRHLRARRPISDVPGLSALFRDDRRQTLLVSADERGGASTDVRLSLIKGRNPFRFSRRADPEAWFVIPTLTPPPRARGIDERQVMGVLAPPFDARQTGGNYGGEGREPDGAYSFAAIETDLDLAAVARHYAAQLEARGWSRTNEGISGPQAWSTWTFEDAHGEPWTGAFTALRLPDSPGRHLLHLRADLRPGGEDAP
jgi:hypothetical protein